MDIFSYSLGSYIYIPFTSVLIHCLLVSLVWFRMAKTSASKWLLLALVVIVLQGLTSAFSILPNNQNGVIFWATLSLSLWVLIWPLLQRFALQYSGVKMITGNSIFSLLLFIPVGMFWYDFWNTDRFLDVMLNPQPWQFLGLNRDLDNATLFLVSYTLLACISSGVALAVYLLKMDDPVKRKQVLFLLGAFFLPLLLIPTAFVLNNVVNFNYFSSQALMTVLMSSLTTFGLLYYTTTALKPASIMSNIIDSMNEILLVINNKNYIEYVNSAVEHQLAYAKVFLEGMKVEKLLGDSWDSFNNTIILPLYKDKDRTSMETELVTSYGTKIPVNFSANAYRNSNGEFMGIVGIATDIRKLKELLDVSAERNKLSAVLESITDGVIALDTEGKVMLINTAALSLLELTSSRVVGKKIDEVVTITYETETVKAESLLPKSDIAKDSIIYRKNGVTVTVSDARSVNVNLISSAIKEGKTLGLGSIIVLHDVSKEKQLDEMKMDFVSMAAHELRTPLTSIRNYLSVLKEDVHPTLSEENKLYFDRITISTDDLLSLVDNLLNVTKIEKGSLTIKTTPTDVLSLVSKAVDQQLPQAQDKKITVTFKKPEKDLPKTALDPLRILEVITNLLSNAITYTESGGSITIWIESNGKEIITHIQDTGKGIPKEALPRLFTKFFRVNTSLEQEAKGNGLGLYISKSIIDLHNGKIWVDTELGKGSTFSFSLPVR